MQTQSVTRATSRRDLAYCLALLLVVKGAFILSLADVFFYGEELEKGAAAKAMLDGLHIAHHRLTYHYYEGGGFVISHLKALTFLVLGENIAAQKLAGLITCVAVFCAGWRLVAWHFGRRPARLFALLFIFAPMSVQKLVLLSLGIHFEAMLFGLLLMDGTLRLVARDAAAQRPRALFGLGLVAGFGLYFSYQLVLIVGWAAVVLGVWRRDLWLSRGSLCILGGGLLGLVPLGIMAVLVGGEIFDVHGSQVGMGLYGDRIAGFVSSAYSGRSALEWLSLTLYPLAALAAVWVAWAAPGAGERRRACTLLAGFQLLWLVAWATSGFAAERWIHFYHWLRFAPLWTVALVLAAAAADAALSRGGAWRRGALLALAALGTLGLAGSARILAAAQPLTPVDNLSVLLETKGYDYAGYIPRILPHLEGPPEVSMVEQLEPLMGFQEADRSLLYADLARASFTTRATTLAEALKILKELDPDRALDFARGLGPLVARHSRGDAARALNAARAMEGELGERLAEAVGRFGGGWRVSPELVEAEIAEHVQRAAGPDQAYLRGVGARVVRAFVLGTYGGPGLILNANAARAFLEDQPALAVPALLAGLEAELRRLRLGSAGH